MPENELISDIEEWLLYGSGFAEFMHQKQPGIA